MKRFFCTICGRVKRVRNYPTNIKNVYADSPAKRVGTCSKHETSFEQAQMTARKVKVGA